MLGKHGAPSHACSHSCAWGRRGVTQADIACFDTVMSTTGRGGQGLAADGAWNGVQAPGPAPALPLSCSAPRPGLVMLQNGGARVSGCGPQRSLTCVTSTESQDTLMPVQREIRSSCPAELLGCLDPTGPTFHHPCANSAGCSPSKHSSQVQIFITRSPLSPQSGHAPWRGFAPLQEAGSRAQKPRL